ncbi:Serine carboxypeptidase S28 [Popillia japonica]|uniref:Serine carboxypeptidase S28 n=1 Tax=Popillia japonica TaxID=7064 RepID=A0AAW1IV25_POPJA
MWGNANTKPLVIILLLTILILAIEAKIILRKFGPPPDDAPNARATRAPQWHTITQRVDHFNPRDIRTWEMRYISNDQFFVEGGPIFIYLGGEWQISAGSLMTGQIFDMAEQHGGMMYYTEHRYYGYSYPTEDMSTENLRYLSLDQAIADVVYFIQYVKANTPGFANSQVVVIGGSYSASMATWIRLKYPHIIDIAYASSAPVRAVADFYEYYEVVDHNIGLVSQECLNTIGEGIFQLEARLETDDGIAEMSQRLETCTTIQNVEPYRSFLFNIAIAEIFAGLVQYAGQTSIQDDCNLLLGFNGTSLDKLIGYVRDYYGNDCIDDYAEFIRMYSAVENTNDAWRPWLYQTCTEYGYYQTTTSDYQPFGNTFGLKFFVDMCTDLFAEDFGTTILDTGIIRTNIFYGSLTPEITKVVSVHGTVDPWHALGILEDLNPLAPAILINGTSHCADLSSIRDTDPPQLIAAKIRIQQLVSEWLLLN